MNAVNAAMSSLLGTTAYHMHAPDNATFPYTVWNWQSGGLTADHDVVDGVEWVRSYGTSAYSAGTLHDSDISKLDSGTISITGYQVIYFRREEDIELSETLPNGQVIYTAGSYYRLIMDK